MRTPGKCEGIGRDTGIGAAIYGTLDDDSVFDLWAAGTNGCADGLPEVVC